MQKPVLELSGGAGHQVAGPQSLTNLVAPQCTLPRDYLSPTPMSRAMGFWVKVECLQSVFWHEIFFELRIFFLKMLRKFPRKHRAFILWVRKKFRKIPAKFPAKCPSKKVRKITDELLQECREKLWVSQHEEIGCSTPPIAGTLRCDIPPYKRAISAVCDTPSVILSWKGTGRYAGYLALGR